MVNKYLVQNLDSLSSSLSHVPIRLWGATTTCMFFLSFIHIIWYGSRRYFALFNDVARILHYASSRERYICLGVEIELLIQSLGQRQRSTHRKETDKHSKTEFNLFFAGKQQLQRFSQSFACALPQQVSSLAAANLLSKAVLEIAKSCDEIFKSSSAPTSSSTKSMPAEDFTPMFVQCRSKRHSQTLRVNQRKVSQARMGAP